MKASALIWMALLTLAAGGTALLLRDGAGGAAPAERGERWLPGLRERVNDVARLELVSGETAVSVVNQDGRWVLEEWGGYPASMDKVAAAAVGLAGLVIDAPMTARAERHAELQLDAPGPGSQSLGLTLKDAAGAVLADVIVGKAAGAKGLYVRRAGENQCWQVDGRLAPPKGAVEWVERELLRIPATEVVEVAVQPAAGPALTMIKDGADWTLQDPPADRIVATAAPFSSLAGALSWFDLEGVASADEAAVERPWNTTTLRTTEGLIVTVQSAKDDEQAWARLAFGRVPQLPGAEAPVIAVDAVTDSGAAGAGEGTTALAPGADAVSAAEGGAPAGSDEAGADAAGAEASDPVPPSDAGQDAAEPDDQAIAEAALAEHLRAADAALDAKVADLSARLSPWTFRIATWKADALVKDLEAFLEPLEATGPPLDEAALDGAESHSADDGHGHAADAGHDHDAGGVADELPADG